MAPCGAVWGCYVGGFAWQSLSAHSLSLVQAAHGEQEQAVWGWAVVDLIPSSSLLVVLWATPCGVQAERLPGGPSLLGCHNGVQVVSRRAHLSVQQRHIVVVSCRIVVGSTDEVLLVSLWRCLVWGVPVDRMHITKGD